MTSEAQRRASKKYTLANTVVLTMRLNKKHDADIIERIGREPNRQGYIKRLVRENIENERFCEEKRQET